MDHPYNTSGLVCFDLDDLLACGSRAIRPGTQDRIGELLLCLASGLQTVVIGTLGFAQALGEPTQALRDEEGGQNERDEEELPARGDTQNGQAMRQGGLHSCHVAVDHPPDCRHRLLHMLFPLGAKLGVGAAQQLVVGGFGPLVGGGEQRVGNG